MPRIPLVIAHLMLALLVGWGVTEPVFAWIYSEHRDISVLAVQKLDPARKAVFDRLWQHARTTHEERLCEQGADTAQGVQPACLDWAALAAIAGDHSCSSEDMSGIGLESDWILKVADVAAQLKVAFSSIELHPPAGQTQSEKDLIADVRRQVQSEGERAARINALRKADNQLQKADPQYAIRARSNYAHFLLARPRTDTTPKEYAKLTLSIESEISAVGVYGWYHLSALQKATRLAIDHLPSEERQRLARSVLFDEAFALHFLQDVFAAGHVAGTWGDDSQRQGTHDFYNANGLEVVFWKGTSQSEVVHSVVLMGDAHMRPEDVERAAVAVRTSLEQVLDTAAGFPRATNMVYTQAAPMEPEAFDVCKNNTLMRRQEGVRATEEGFQLAAEVLQSTPIPGLGPGLGAMPRFRSEVGPFLGLATALDGRYVDGSFTPSESGGVVGGVELAARLGLGLEGVTGESGDGLVFLTAGLRGESSSSHSIADPALAQIGGNLAAAMPARMGISARLRMPFYVIPGDLLLLAPLYFFAPEQYTRMAVSAANGGLLGWQSGWATAIGRFQFVLGRELGVVFYGVIDEDRVLAPGSTPGASPDVIAFKSIYIDVPIVEYKPFRAFGANQSSTLLFQLFSGVYVPTSATVAAPVGASAPDLDSVWSVGLRLLFDWRHYP